MSQDIYVDLGDWIQIKISGPQTMEYLNGIVTLDLEKISESEFYRSAFLTPKAKLRSIFWVRKEADAIFLYAPEAYKQNLVEDLLKYKLSMEVKLEDVTEETDPLYLVPSDQKIPGLSCASLSMTFVNRETPPPGEQLSFDQFQATLIEAGIAPPSVMLDQNPYELGIDDVITLEKGCFLGQEPISRMYHRGNPRKFVYHVQYSGPAGTILKDGEEVGEVLATAGDRAVAYIRRQVEDFDRLQVGDQPLAVLGRIGSYPANERS